MMRPAHHPSPEPADTALSQTGASLHLHGIGKSFATATALQDIDVTLPEGRFSVLLGPSGCGKSTLLRLIAGLDHPTNGTIALGDTRIDHLPPKSRNLSMVFQSYALFPHLDVAENILFGLSVRGTPKRDRAVRLQKVAAMMGLSEFLTRKPAELSGGQQQRVALARAVISERPVCLMDEPLSNLDAKLRADMRVEIRALQQRLGLTMVYVTHDQVEAMTMADRIVVMNAGRIEQVASPRRLYAQPATVFVAGFIGTPPMNLVPRSALPGLTAPDSAVTIGIRPEDVTRLDGSEGPQVAARLVSVEYLGADQLVTLTIDGAKLLLRQPGDAAPLPATLDLRLPQKALHFFDTAGQRLPSPSDMSIPHDQEFHDDHHPQDLADRDRRAGSDRL